MLIILTAGILVVAVSVVAVWYVCLQAPEGYEDQTGFHVTAESAIAVKSANQNCSAPLKSQNDHEPIAA